MSPRVSSLLAAAAATVCCARAAAQPRVAVLPFDGPMNQRARGAVVDALQNSGAYELVSTQEVLHTAESAGADLATPPGRVAVASAMHLGGYVTGSVSKRGSTLVVQLTVYQGASGQAVGVGSVSAKKAALVRVLKKKALEQLKGPLAQAAAPEQAPAREQPALAVAPAREPEPRRQPKAQPRRAQQPPPPRAPAERAQPAEQHEEADLDDIEAQAAEPEAEPEPRPIALELGLALHLVTRHMAYNDAAIELGESSYELTPNAALSLRWYPAAHFSSGAAAHVGLEASGQLMYPIDSTRDSVAFETSSHAFAVGLHGRLPLGPHELGLSLGYGQHVVEIADGDGGVDPGVPSVSYGFGRAGLDARFAFGETFGLRLGGAYRLLLSYGELGEDAWFHRTSGGAIEAELALRFTVAKPLVIEAGVALWRYFLKLDPEPTDRSVIRDARIAGGITDQYLIGGLGAALQL